MLMQGYNKDKACVLLALDALFGDDVDWGREFLEEFYIDTGCNGFNIPSDLILIEESAPIIALVEGSFTSTYNQGEPYWQVVHWDTGLRYRLPYNDDLILMYVTDQDKRVGHTVCIKAARVNEYLDKYKFHALLLPKLGRLIIDYIDYSYQEDNIYE